MFDAMQSQMKFTEAEAARIMHQLLLTLNHMHAQDIIHRDLKLENILIDDNLDLKVADFGFATYKSIDALKSYRGTMTYMAPEIKEGKVYKGTQVDLFSVGVILFIIVQGIFPFKEARKEEFFYNLILTGQIDTYFQKVNGANLSMEFKDLILGLFSYDPEKRLTIDQIKSHPWLNMDGFNFEETRASLLAQAAQKSAAQN